MPEEMDGKELRKKFDLDLLDGLEGEELTKALWGMLAMSYIEVKNDIYVSASGNVAIEYEYNGNPSGIEATEAQWWAIVLDGSEYFRNIVVFIQTSFLKEKCEKLKGLPHRDVKGGDNNLSRMYLVPVNELVAGKSEKQQTERKIPAQETFSW